MRKITLLLFLTLVAVDLYAQDTTQQIVAGRQNASEQLNKPYLILISADGFRYDYAVKYNATHLLALSNDNVKAESMIPSFPSLTFPNHYSIATGMYPSHHGIVDNQFYDRNRKATYTMSDRNTVGDGSWYGGTPIWVLAEQQGMLSAAYYFVGTEAPIQNIRPTYWYRFNDKVDIDFRIDKVVQWLQLPEAVRPHLITFYLSNVDHAGHMYGPETPQTEAAVHFVDNAIGKMVAKVDKLNLPVNYIFVSDHGMTAVDTATRLNLSSGIDTTKFIVRGGGATLQLYAKDTSFTMNEYDVLKKDTVDYTTYLRNDIPAKWHYSAKDDRFGRIGDIFIAPKLPKVFSWGDRRINPGAHGFDPALKDMHAVFYAWGPAFKKEKKIASFENVNVYPLMCRILGLHYEHAIDGKLEVLEGVLK